METLGALLVAIGTGAIVVAPAYAAGTICGLVALALTPRARTSRTFLIGAAMGLAFHVFALYAWLGSEAFGLLPYGYPIAVPLILVSGRRIVPSGKLPRAEALRAKASSDVASNIAPTTTNNDNGDESGA